jgi:hypothetical protein
MGSVLWLSPLAFGDGGEVEQLLGKIDAFAATAGVLCGAGLASASFCTLRPDHDDLVAALGPESPADPLHGQIEELMTRAELRGAISDCVARARVVPLDEQDS